MRSIASRFDGPEGARLLTEAFERQPIAGGTKSVAAALARACRIESWEHGQVVIRQGDTDNDIVFILLGSVTIEANGRSGPVRGAGAHVGEMALIDLHMRRSATVRTLEPTVTARISEPDFTGIANAYPHLWRELAIEMVRRLRQRLADVVPRNDIPSVFIGSSREGLGIAECIRDGIADHGRREVRVWTDGVFGASETTIESLEDAVRRSDFGILVLSPDDKVSSRERTERAPRDNVIFELGLFMGALGRKRTFVVRPRRSIKVLTDLLGVTPLSYDDEGEGSWTSRLWPICEDLSAAINRAGPK